MSDSVTMENKESKIPQYLKVLAVLVVLVTTFLIVRDVNFVNARGSSSSQHSENLKWPRHRTSHASFRTSHASSRTTTATTRRPRPVVIGTTTAAVTTRRVKLTPTPTPTTATTTVTTTAIATATVTCASRMNALPKSVAERKCGKNCDQLTCMNFFYSAQLPDKNNTLKPVLVKQLEWFTKKYKPKMKPDSYFSSLNCTALRARYQFNRVVATELEIDFPLAFNLVVHKDAEQVVRQLALIYRPHNTYCIHVDAKSPDHMIAAMRHLANCLRNTFVASRLQTVIYAGYSRLQAEINCMQDQLKSKVRWKYLLNTAGQALPLRSNHDMVRVLLQLNHRNDIEAMLTKEIKYRYKYQWYENYTTMHVDRTRKKNPAPPYGIKVIGGNAYAAFTREFVQWTLSDSKPKAFLEWCKKTYSPDEHYWASLHHAYTNPQLNAPGSYKGYPNETFISVTANWEGNHFCNGSWSSHKICIFNIVDVAEIIKRNNMFANKFDIGLHALGYECLENWILYQEVCPHPFDISAYKFK